MVAKNQHPPKISLNKEVRMDQVEEESYIHKCMSFFRLKYNAMIKSKVPVCLLVSIYIFICVLGNIVTGIIFFKHRGEEDRSETLNTITNKLHLNDNITTTALNNTEANLEYFDYSEEYAAHSEEWNLYLMFANDSNNETTSSSPDPHDTTCFESIKDYENFREVTKYWIEGVGILVVGSVGLLGNLLAILVFRRSRGNKGFHKLLIILAVFDCLLIIDCFIENSILPHFTSISPVEPYWFTVAYPYFWFPFKGIIRTAAIYMMVAISAERFRAVCYPISKRHSPYKYALLVLVTSVVLKLPRFLSFKLITIEAINVTEYWTTSIMEDPDYIRFSSYWDDLFVTGFLPLCISIFFNLKIYLKIRSSANMKCDRFVGTGKTNTLHLMALNSKPHHGSRSPYSGDSPPTVEASPPKIIANSKDIEDGVYKLNGPTTSCLGVDVKQHSPSSTASSKRNDDLPVIFCNEEVLKKSTVVTIENHKDFRMPVFPDVHQNQRTLTTAKDNRNYVYGRSISTPPLETRNDRPECVVKLAEVRSCDPSKYSTVNCQLVPDACDEIEMSTHHEIQTCKQPIEITPPVGNISRTIFGRKFSSPPLLNCQDTNALRLNKLKVRTEGSAMVLASIIILFLIAHSFRLAFKIYEINLANDALTIEKFKICFALKRFHVPVIFYLMFHLNNLFIVINSSFNFILCYFVGTEFRKQTIALFKEIKENCYACITRIAVTCRRE